VPVFSGKSSQDVHAFIARFQRLISVYDNLPYKQKCFYLDNSCEGAAAKLVAREIQWLEENPGNLTEDQKFNHLLQKLREYFGTITDIQVYRDLLQRRVKRPTESYFEYMEEVLDLCRKCNIMTVPEQIKELHKGIDYHLALSLSHTAFDSVPAFIQAVMARDSAHRSLVRTHTYSSMETGSALPPGTPAVPTMPSLVPSPAPAAALPASFATAAPAPPEFLTKLDDIVTKLESLMRAANAINTYASC
jgi:hypothetical protein